jgi:hypothetical protein
MMQQSKKLNILVASDSFKFKWFLQLTSRIDMNSTRADTWIKSTEQQSNRKSKFPIICNVCDIGVTAAWQKFLHKPNTMSKLQVFSLVFMKVFPGDTEDQWVNSFRFMHCNTNTNPTGLCCNGSSMREDDGQCC